MTLRTKAARGLKWQAIEIGGRQLLSLAVFTTLARLLDPSAFGSVALVGAYLALVAVFTDFGIGTALIQRRELDPRHVNSAFWFNVLCAAVLCAATVALARPLAVLFGDAGVAPLLRWASLSLIINAAAATHGTLFFRDLDFRSPTLRTLVAAAVGGVVGVGMALLGYGVWALVGQQLTASLAGALFLWTASRWRPALEFSLPHLRELLAVSASVSGVSLLYFFSSRLDQLLIGRYLGTNPLGEYVVGGKFAELARTALQQPLAAVSMPALSRLQDEHERLSGAMYKGMELNALVTIPAFVGLAAVAPDLVPLAFGAQWQLAAGVLQLMALYSLAAGLFVYCHPALLATGASGRYLLLHAGCAAGTGVACVVGLRFGVQAVVVGLIINAMVSGLAALVFLRQLIGLSPWKYLRPCVEPGMAAALMYGVVTLSRPALNAELPPWASLLAQVLIGAIAYMAILYGLIPDRLAVVRDMAVSAFAKPAQDGEAVAVAVVEPAPAINGTSQS
ncbi:MAG TPA: lipopolysaccharide biosynthesis protein [Tepidisphaeraceae bacterium]|nr:lipopolysaccharide biosynthesis protein [Tepidisphaeraceae bacterium]